MKCLALDTTTDVCSLALADESGLIAGYDFAHKMDLSRRLMPNVVSMLKDCGLETKDVQAVGVSIGPGSFTGLRMGVTTAKTLAQALNIPIVGIVTLDLLAQQFDYLPDGIICPLIKVRKGEVYYAFYHASGGTVARMSEYAAAPITDVIKHALEHSALCTPHSALVFAGDALEQNLPTLCDALGDRAVPAPAWLRYPKASILARLALQRISSGQADDFITLVPFYIRKSAPEQRLDECPRQ
jgi:tRNA threonylcarbamoyladenosine biosynthesis protein TsaB